LPDLSWELEEADGKLIMTVQSDQKPEKVSAWIADAETRDFRKSTWKASPTEESGDGYRYELPIPAKGYAAMFGEAEFKVEGLTYFLSTNVKIVQAEDGAEDAAKDEAKKN
jgi:PhoPQ-activated pathogenicity-related protein